MEALELKGLPKITKLVSDRGEPAPGLHAEPGLWAIEPGTGQPGNPQSLLRLLLLQDLFPLNLHLDFFNPNPKIQTLILW